MEHLSLEVIGRYTQLFERGAEVSRSGEDMMTFGERNASFIWGNVSLYIILRD